MPTIIIQNEKEKNDPKQNPVNGDKTAPAPATCPRCAGKVKTSGERVGCVDCGRTWTKSEFEKLTKADPGEEAESEDDIDETIEKSTEK